MKKTEDQFLRSNVQTELPERHQRWQWAEKNCCLWQCAITETLGREGWGLPKGIWLIKRAKVAPHTDPALGLRNGRYLRGMIPLKAKQACGYGYTATGEGGCPCELGQRDVRWGCRQKCPQKPLDPVESGLRMAFWRLHQWNQKTAFSQLLLLLYYIWYIIYVNNILYYYYYIISL